MDNERVMPEAAAALPVGDTPNPMDILKSLSPEQLAHIVELLKTMGAKGMEGLEGGADAIKRFYSEGQYPNAEEAAMAQEAREKAAGRQPPATLRRMGQNPEGRDLASPVDQTKEFASKLMGAPGVDTARQKIPSIEELQNWAAKKFRPGS